jgi:hypothetical protein
VVKIDIIVILGYDTMTSPSEGDSSFFKNTDPHVTDYNMGS